jgi:hypothetical protein
MTLEVEGLRPGGRLAFLLGDGPGDDEMPAGPCAGVSTNLRGWPAHYGPFTDRDGDGAFRASPTIPAGVCGRWLSVVDLETCAVSAPVPFSGAGGGDCRQVRGVNTDDTFSDEVSAGGIPVGMKYVPPVGMNVNRLEVFTGEVEGEEVLALYSHNASLDQPGVALAEGRFRSARANGWQGADLDRSVALTAGTTYWIVWEPQPGAQWTQAPAGSLVTYKATSDGMVSWFGPFSDIYKHKLLYCE